MPLALASVSVGVAEIAADEPASDWLHQADAAMYEARRRGRNHTMAAD